jgi:hypothetical protein
MLDRGESKSRIPRPLTCIAQCQRQRQLELTFSQVVSTVTRKAGVRGNVVDGATDVPRDQSENTIRPGKAHNGLQSVAVSKAVHNQYSRLRTPPEADLPSICTRKTATRRSRG